MARKNARISPMRSAATLLARCVRMFPGRCASPRVPRQTSATLVRTLRVQGASSNASNLHAPTSSTDKQGAFKLYPIIFYLYIVCLFPLPDFYETKIIIKKKIFLGKKKKKKKKKKK